MFAWCWSGSGGEKGGRYCGAVGSARSDIWDGAVVYMGMLGAPLAVSANGAGGE